MSQRETTLPRRPRLLSGLAVLRRGQGEIQLGLDPRHAVVIEGLPAAIAESVRLLDGRCTIDQLIDRIPDPDRPALIELCHELNRLGLVEDAAEARVPGRLAADTMAWTLRTGGPPAQLAATRRSAAVLVHGAGRIAIAVASLLVAAGVGAVDMDADGLVGPQDTGCGYRDEDVGKPRREAARETLTRQDAGFDGTRVTTPNLVVLTDAAVPVPEFVTGLLTGAVPHLAARAREGVGIVGPFVVPGRSSCLGCADLVRAELDPCWPTVAAQLAGRSQPADLACAQATAALAVEQALRAVTWLAHGGRRPRHGTRPSSSIRSTLGSSTARGRRIRPAHAGRTDRPMGH
jgi:hypothetical protein